MPDAAEVGELPCVGCGYDLRAQTRDGTCPECGAAVARALHGDALRVAPRDWLVSLRRGLSLLSLSFATLVFTCPALALTLYVRPWQQPAERVWAALAIGSTLVAAVAAFVGLLLATRPDPREQARPTGWNARRRTRAAALAIALLVALVLLGAGPLGLSLLSAKLRRFGAFLFFAMLLAVLGAWFAQHLAVILGRAASADTSWARSARVMVLVTAAIGLIAGGALVLEMTTGRGGAIAGIGFFHLPLLIWIDLMILWGLAGRARDAVLRATEAPPPEVKRSDFV